MKLKQGVSGDLALMCQVAELHGTISGDVDFYGQIIRINDDCIIDGDLNIKGAQIVELKGVVMGEVTGSYAIINDNSPTAELEKELSQRIDLTEEAEDQQDSN